MILCGNSIRNLSSIFLNAKNKFVVVEGMVGIKKHLHFLVEDHGHLDRLVCESVLATGGQNLVLMGQDDPLLPHLPPHVLLPEVGLPHQPQGQLACPDLQLVSLLLYLVINVGLNQDFLKSFSCENINFVSLS